MADGDDAGFPSTHWHRHASTRHGQIQKSGDMRCVDAVALATTAETIDMATADVRPAVHSFPLASCRTPSSYNMFKTGDPKYSKSWNGAVGFKNQQDNRT
ncbi:hypothetical protein MCOR14_005271 [Pyricularia oryzae]|nr:hypothetical protein MCOR14_005271 [Pyricularia oryzae]